MCIYVIITGSTKHLCFADINAPLLTCVGETWNVYCDLNGWVSSINKTYVCVMCSYFVTVYILGSNKEYFELNFELKYTFEMKVDDAINRINCICQAMLSVDSMAILSPLQTMAELHVKPTSTMSYSIIVMHVGAHYIVIWHPAIQVV